MFVEESDTIVPITGERAISFSKFINLAIEYNLFSEVKTKVFQESITSEVKRNYLTQKNKLLFFFLKRIK